MTERTASCRCGQLRVTVSGEPIRISVVFPDGDELRHSTM